MILDDEQPGQALMRRFDIFPHTRPVEVLVNTMKGPRGVKVGTDGVSVEGNEDYTLNRFRDDSKVQDFNIIREEFFCV